jgi:disulfide bond formation protein DsbB
MRASSRLIWAAVGLTSLASVGLAILAQYRLDMQPCPWCILQRLIYIVIGVLSLMVAGLPADGRGWSRRLGQLLAGLVGAFAMAGMATALYQNQVASKSASCDMTLADRIISGLGLDALWPAAFEVRASCAEAAASLMGVPVELWSLALYTLLGSVAVNRLLAGRR